MRRWQYVLGTVDAAMSLGAKGFRVVPGITIMAQQRIATAVQLPGGVQGAGTLVTQLLLMEREMMNPDGTQVDIPYRPGDDDPAYPKEP